VQKFVDDFFGTILKVPGSKFPAPVKWLFDLLDDVAVQHNLLNTEETTNSCLSVIAQTFMDSCSLDENILGINSKLPKELPHPLRYEE